MTVDGHGQVFPYNGLPKIVPCSEHFGKGLDIALDPRTCKKSRRWRNLSSGELLGLGETRSLPGDGAQSADGITQIQKRG